MTRTQLEGSVLAGRRQDRGSSTGAEKANCNIEKKTGKETDLAGKGNNFRFFNMHWSVYVHMSCEGESDCCLLILLDAIPS